MKSIKIIFLLCLSFNALKAQSVISSKRAADVYFLNKEYYAAAKYYQKALQISQDSAFVVPYGFEANIKQEGPKKDEYEYAVFQLANSLRLYRNYQDAEKWFAIALQFTNPKYVLSGYWYGECLRANLRYEEAIVAFTNFIAKNNGTDGYTERAKLEIESCKFALEEIKFPRLVRIAKLPKEVNAQGSNYSPLVNHNILYFTSSRPVSTSGKTEVLTGGNAGVSVEKKETPYINTVYAASGNLSRPRIEIDKVFPELKNLESAAPAIHPNGNVMFITLWLNKPDKKRSIYVSKKENEKWSSPAILGGEINVMGFNAMQPFVSSDGKYLIFSSDRPGGSGKYDLWYAPLRSDYSVGNAINLGPTINTKDDEQAPYYNSETKSLLFSSNGRVGIGGFDFYEAIGDFVKWGMVKNMGYPFNSAKDDMYFTAVDQKGKVGYISSDRESLCCLEIFHVAKSNLTISGKLIDCETLKPLVGANIILSAKDMETQKVVSDENGDYRFSITSNRGFELKVEKDNYFAKSISYNYDQLARTDTIFKADACLTPFKIDKPILLENILYEFDKATLTDSSKIILNKLYTIMTDNQNIEIELSAHTDNMGSHSYNIDLSERRAKSCVDYLVTRGIAPERMKSKGYGYTIPVAENKLRNGMDNPQGRALNRRTEFKVTKK